MFPGIPALQLFLLFPPKVISVVRVLVLYWENVSRFRLFEVVNYIGKKADERS